MNPPTHAEIDTRLLHMIQACVEKIDAQPELLVIVRDNLTRVHHRPVAEHWHRLLTLPWAELRIKLLEESEQGADLRQSAPFGRILTTAERLSFYAPRCP